MRNFMEMLKAKWAEGKFVCVGLDSDYEKIPGAINDPTDKTIFQTIVYFNRAIVQATSDIVCSYKLNSAFYEQHGSAGLEALHRTIRHASAYAPIILDFKRGDIGNTNQGYVKSAFDHLEADAITINPYMGKEDAADAFLGDRNKGVFVLCKTSNKGASEFQDLFVTNGHSHDEPDSTTLYQYVAQQVSKNWNENGNCGLVVGATHPAELQRVRETVGDMPILIPGVGSQGGDLEATVKSGMDSRGQGIIVNSSRGIIFASNGPDFVEAARRETEKLHNEINQYRR